MHQNPIILCNILRPHRISSTPSPSSCLTQGCFRLSSVDVSSPPRNISSPTHHIATQRISPTLTVFANLLTIPREEKLRQHENFPENLFSFITSFFIQPKKATEFVATGKKAKEVEYFVAICS
jgi:hypothetical protein